METVIVEMLPSNNEQLLLHLLLHKHNTNHKCLDYERSILRLEKIMFINKMHVQRLRSVVIGYRHNRSAVGFFLRRLLHGKPTRNGTEHYLFISPCRIITKSSELIVFCFVFHGYWYSKKEYKIIPYSLQSRCFGIGKMEESRSGGSNGFAVLSW